MGKEKPRHEPHKPQNKYGDWCQYAETSKGNLICERGYGDTSICKGNRHNCVKTKYHKLACRSDKQKLNSENR